MTNHEKYSISDILFDSIFIRRAITDDYRKRVRNVFNEAKGIILKLLNIF